MAGYEIELDDFRQLLSDERGRREIARLLHDWYGHSISGRGAQTMVQNSAGEVAPIAPLLAMIQADPERQLILYRTAMSIWR